MTEPVIRPAIEADIPEINAIYNRYIVYSHVSFDLEPWSNGQRLEWFGERVADGYPVMVACEGDTVVGASWAGPWQPKRAYRSSVESTVVLAPEAKGRGLGTALYSKLLELLRADGFHRAFAIIALPNDASVALHRNLGFTEIGVLDEAGFKDGRYYSTMLMQLALE